MITAPDFRQKQILFLNTYTLGRCNLSFRNENIVITLHGRIHDKMPIRHLLAVFIIGEMTLTSQLIRKCMKNGVSLFLLTRTNETYATIGAYAEGNYLLRQKQYALSEERMLEIARAIVLHKTINQLALLRSIGVNTIGIRSRSAYKKEVKEKLAKATDAATLRGIEGSVSRDFFTAYFSQIEWYKRVPRGKVDPNNVLLDMGYTYLFNFVDSLLRVYGFDTYKGMYHRLFFQRKSLSSDVMEPFRCIIDRALYKTHTLGQFRAADFRRAKGKYYLDYQHSHKYAKIFLTEIMRYKEDMYKYVRSLYYMIINDEGELEQFTIR